ncbi:MAG: phasin family protein [Kiloniellaceae bacterium]
MSSKTGKGEAGSAAPSAWSLPFPGLKGGSEAGFDSLLEANAKAAEIWLESWTKLADESAGFLSKRWQQDLDLMEQILACKSPLELLQLQSTFLQKTLVDYMNETGKLADMETDAGVAEVEALDEGAKAARKPGPVKPTQ